VDRGPVGHRALGGGDHHRRREQQLFQPGLVETLGQGPGQAGPRGALEIVADRGVRCADRAEGFLAGSAQIALHAAKLATADHVLACAVRTGDPPWKRWSRTSSMARFKEANSEATDFFSRARTRHLLALLSVAQAASIFVQRAFVGPVTSCPPQRQVALKRSSKQEAVKKSTRFTNRAINIPCDVPLTAQRPLLCLHHQEIQSDAVLAASLGQLLRHNFRDNHDQYLSGTITEID